MNTKSFFFLFFLVSLPLFAQKTDEQYIADFAKYAVEEMQLYKIPASITLAQGLLETADGQSELAQNANNHFGIKCKKEWTGETYRYTDDAYMECFRKYSSVRDSYRDHSKFLAERPYYKDLFKLDIYDYKAWAYGLKKSGYATNPKYAPLIIAKIEKYRLYEFDRLQLYEVDSKIAQLYPNSTITYTSEYVENSNTQVVNEPVKETQVIIRDTKTHTKIDTILKAPNNRIHPLERIKRNPNKNLKYILLEKGETLYQVSQLYNEPVEKLIAYNEISDPAKLPVNSIIYLQKKKTKGKYNFHTVEEGETLYSIAQTEGMQLESLAKRNRVSIDYQVKVGESLYLNGKKKKAK